MKFQILHESKQRLRAHILSARMTVREADILDYYLRMQESVYRVRVFERTGDVIVEYQGEREQILKLLKEFHYDEHEKDTPKHNGRELRRSYEEKMAFTLLTRAISVSCFPHDLKLIRAVVMSVPYLWKGLKTLLSGKIEVPILDATAILTSLVRNDHETASSVMFLLTVGDILDEWTHKKSVDDLARTMSLGVDKVWTLRQGEEILLPVTEVNPGDTIIVRTGNMIPLDGKVLSGEAMVNQSSMTGEAQAVRKAEGSYTYAGTVVEEGECRITVEKKSGTGRYDRIVKMIEDSEKLKSQTETRAAHLADSLVPYSFLGAGITYLLTRNATKALSFLMVDFSCALKLSMPVSVLSAMREASSHQISVKGGKFLEAVADATTIVFDKTGTLTYAKPRVAAVIPFGHHEENEMLRMAACLEEHFPHSVANAVVAEAKVRQLKHEEKHSKVEYIVAHGIASHYDEARVLIGSHHFIFEDENCRIPEEEKKKFENLPEEYSILYMAMNHELCAAILISDPLRTEAKEVVSHLRREGIHKVVMMTGDNHKTAASVARMVGLDEFYAEVLPEDKAAFIRKEHALGHKVIMIGDGINDSPALSEADCGIAIQSGAAIAREVADITISANDLYQLVILKRLSKKLMRRIQNNYHFIICFNAGLILFGVLGMLRPATSALFHNTSTLLIGLESMRNLLPQEELIKP